MCTTGLFTAGISRSLGGPLRHALAAVVVFASAFWSSAFAAVPEYEALRSAQVNAGSIKVSNFTLEHDAITFAFAAGSFHFLDSVNGTPFAAVFVGEGSYSLKPATAGELRHLRLVTGDQGLEALSDSFDDLVLFFTDDTASQIRAAGEEVAASTPTHARAVDAYRRHMDLQKKEYQINLHLRVLADLLNKQGGTFIAAVDGERHAPAIIAVDPMGIGNLAAQLSFAGGEEVAFLSSDSSNGGFWYLSALRPDAREGRGKPLVQTAEALHYEVTTTIGSRSAITGQTVIHLKGLVRGIRVLPIQLLPKLRISGATLADGSEIGFVQEDVRLGAWKRLVQDEAADGDAALVFPSPLSTSQPTVVRIAYEGTDVLQGIGMDSYSVRARESWYPNLHAFVDPATYHLTFRFPKSMSLVSVGKLESETIEAGQKIAVWKSGEPMRVAGFNYGKFKKRSHKDEMSGVSIDMYTNREWQKMAENVMADAINATRTGTHYFGPPPHATLSVTQQSEWFFGQSWPTLVFLPTLALTTQTERVFGFEEAGPMGVSSINEFAETVTWHEVAHQWWGHKVGWESYRDQWLSEGIAEFTAALTLQITRGPNHYDDYWERRRRDIIQKRGLYANHQAGAITQGWRLATRQSPAAAQAMIYYKGAYVIHMLRMMLWDPSSQNPDSRFVAMMRDFITSFSGRSPSTHDFQTVVERHMIPTMNGAGDNTMGWFFDQWVFGTDIPNLASDLKAESTADGRYRLSGTISQSRVSRDFITLVPLYADFGGDSLGHVGAVRLVGNERKAIDVIVTMSQPPRRVAINLRHDVLTSN